MKRACFIIVLCSVAFLLQDCSSGKKAYTRGDYYESVMKSTNRLRRSPNHKKSIETLRDAYPLAVSYYENQAQNKIDSNEPFKWKGVVQSYTMINNMYIEINRSPGALKVIPNPVDYYAKLSDAKNRAAEESYIAGLREMETGNRENAKQAYRYFIEADNFVPGYKDVKNKIEEALWMATLKVVVKPIPFTNRNVEVSAEFFENKFEEYVRNQNFNQFVRFFSEGEAGRINLDNPDQILEISFDEFTVGQLHFKEQQIEMTNDSIVVARVDPGDYSAPVTGGVISSTGNSNNPDPAGDSGGNTNTNTNTNSNTNTDTNSNTGTNTNTNTNTNTGSSGSTGGDQGNTDSGNNNSTNTSSDSGNNQGNTSTNSGGGSNSGGDSSNSGSSGTQGGANNSGSQGNTNSGASGDDGSSSQGESGDTGNSGNQGDQGSTNTNNSDNQDSNSGNNSQGEGNTNNTDTQEADDDSDDEEDDDDENENDDSDDDDDNESNSEDQEGDDDDDEGDDDESDDDEEGQGDSNSNTGTTGSSGKVAVCHIPPGNPDKKHTIYVNSNALDAHLGHGDTVGECVDSKGKGSKKPKGNNSNSIAISSNNASNLLIEGEDNEPDTLINVYGTVKATVFIYTKTLTSNGILDFRVIDSKTGGLITQEKMPGEYIWISQWANFNGDERALSEEQLRLTKVKEATPPDSQQMFVEFTKPIFDQMVQKVRNFYSRY